MKKVFYTVVLQSQLGPRAGELLLQEDGGVRLIRRAETPEDYFATVIWD